MQSSDTPHSFSAEVMNLNQGMKRLLTGFGVTFLATLAPRIADFGNTNWWLFMGGNAFLFAIILGWYAYKRHALKRLYA